MWYLAVKSVRGFFFFSSRRRHTRYWRDWSSDVCSSDLGRWPCPTASPRCFSSPPVRSPPPTRSEERRVGKSVDLGGRRIIKKKKKNQRTKHQTTNLKNKEKNRVKKQIKTT